MSMRLGRRGDLARRGGRAPDTAWITTVVPWSPASIWPSLIARPNCVSCGCDTGREHVDAPRAAGRSGAPGRAGAGHGVDHHGGAVVSGVYLAVTDCAPELRLVRMRHRVGSVQGSGGQHAAQVGRTGDALPAAERDAGAAA